jgi:hypothetical protein
VRRSLALVMLAVTLAATSSRPAYADGGSWNVSVGGSLVTAQLLAKTGDQVNLVLENKVSLEPFDMPAAGVVLDALGFGGGYSQEVSWSNNGAGPVVKCPNPLVDLFIFCHDESSGGWAVIPDGLPTQLVLSGPAGNANLLVKPSVHSLEYDSALMAVAIVFTVLSSNPKKVIIENLRFAAAVATKIAPEAAGYAAAVQRKDYIAADFEMLSLAKRAAATIADDITQWSIGAIADLSPLALEIKLAVTIGQIDVTLVNLAARLLIGDASSVVTVEHPGSAGPTPTPTPSPTPTPTPSPTPTPLGPPPAPTHLVLQSGAQIPCPSGGICIGASFPETISWAQLQDKTSHVEIFNVTSDPLGDINGQPVTCASALNILVKWLKPTSVSVGSGPATYGFDRLEASSEVGATSVQFRAGYGSDYEGSLCGFYARAVNPGGASSLVFAGDDSRMTW